MGELDVSDPISAANRVARFFREAKVVAAVSHPNVMQIYDMGELDGAPYLVMELVEGSSLSAYLNRNGILDPSEVASIGSALLSGLLSAHEARIVHRDLKPANIQILPDGSPKILDFGIASMSSATSLTATGAIMGTVYYMSPEQCQGLPVDHRSDLFSMGVIFFEMLTGQVPFDAPSNWEILAQIIHKEPQIPNHLPRQVQDFLKKALEKNVDARFQSAAEMSDALSRMVGRAQPLVPSPAKWTPPPPKAVLAQNPIILPKVSPVVASGMTAIQLNVPWTLRWRECTIVALLSLLVPFLRFPFVLVAGGFAIYHWQIRKRPIASASYWIPGLIMLAFWSYGKLSELSHANLTVPTPPTTIRETRREPEPNRPVTLPSDASNGTSKEPTTTASKSAPSAKPQTLTTDRRDRKAEVTHQEPGTTHSPVTEQTHAPKKADPKPQPEAKQELPSEDTLAGRRGSSRVGDGGGQATSDDPPDDSAGRRGGSRVGGN